MTRPIALLLLLVFPALAPLALVAETKADRATGAETITMGELR